ncbi:MAG TPA: CsbD family protein [Burkholderiales bacterium]|jgi:uncharacterized protein YjbJ (UPF0337 family)
MNRDRMEGICRQLSGAVKQRWGALTADPLAAAEGARDRILGKMQELRGLSRQEADRQLDEFMRRNRNWWDLSGR